MSALVTGGASGIGREVAGRLRDTGHDVVVWDRAGGDIDCDISDPEAVTAAMSHTVREHTWIDPETGLTCRHGNFMGIPSSDRSNMY